MLVGVCVAAAFLLAAAALIVSTYLSAKASGDLSGANGVIGFMMFPFVALVGAPWSLVFILNSENAPLIMSGVIVGPLINGAIIGAIGGYVAKIRKNRE
jgi:hypothetical protein